MAMMKCNSCGGTYPTDQRDGTRYYHVCPPVLRLTVDRGGNTIQIDPADLRPTDILTVRRGKLEVKAAVAALLEDDTRLGDVMIPRVDARDENVRVVDYKPDGTAITEIKSEGKGTAPAP